MEHADITLLPQGLGGQILYCIASMCLGHACSQHICAGMRIICQLEHAGNMLLARVGFDLLRSETFQGLVKAHIQRKMNELRLPDFINSLEVCAGSPEPELRVDGVLGTSRWPRAAYQGGKCLHIQSKMNKLRLFEVIDYIGV